LPEETVWRVCFERHDSESFGDAEGQLMNPPEFIKIAKILVVIIAN
jgi:hypothetical protein